MHTFIDLFCGIGGFRRALEEKSMECLFSCDINEHARDAYEKNFNERPAGDITQIPESKIPKHDVLCAGFPCQPFSTAGKKGGMGVQCGMLFYEIIRIARYHMPSVLLLENVRNILNIQNGAVIKTIEAEFDAIGYTVHKYLLNASSFCIPQARRRVYFICLRKDMDLDVDISYLQPDETRKTVYLSNILEKNVDDSLYVKRDDIVIDREFYDNEPRPLLVGYLNKHRQGERIYSHLGHAVTISAFGGGVGGSSGLYYDGDCRVRKLSISECKSVMGFKQSHYVSDGRRGYQQLGNAVIPQMIQYIYDSIVIR